MVIFLSVTWKDCSQPSLHVVLCGPEMPDLLKDGTILSPWLDYNFELHGMSVLPYSRRAVLCITAQNYEITCQ